jgi:phosphoribosylformylglycinamidine synthase
MSGILLKNAPVGNLFARRSHLLINSINDFISTQTVSSGRRIHYNDARFPLAHPESFEDERLMMEILRGSPALSAFRINKLLARFRRPTFR